MIRASYAVADFAWRRSLIAGLALIESHAG